MKYYLKDISDACKLNEIFIHIHLRYKHSTKSSNIKTLFEKYRHDVYHFMSGNLLV